MKVEFQELILYCDVTEAELQTKNLSKRISNVSKSNLHIFLP